MSIGADLALRYLGDSLFGALLGQAGPTRPAGLIRALPRGMRVGVGLIRQVLEDDERFVEIAGRFDLAERETLRNRPFGGAVSRLLEGYGRPMPEDLMVSGLTRLRGGSPEYFRRLLEQYASRGEDVVSVADHLVAKEWLLLLEGDDEEAVLFFNGLHRDEELRELSALCRKLDLRKRDPALTAVNILETLDRPLAPRQLAFLTWTHHPQIFEPVEFVAALLERDDVAPAAGLWMIRRHLETLHEELRRLSDALAGAGEELPEVDIAAVLEQEPPTTPYRLADEDREAIMAVLSSTGVPIGVDELVIDLLEIQPGQRKFAAAVHEVNAVLRRARSVVRVGPGRYMSREAIPEWVHEVPEALCPAVTGDPEDVVLELEALPDDLRAAVLDPVYEDVCAGVTIEVEPEQMAGDSTRYSLLHHHYIVGTMALRTMDRELFAGDAPVTLLLMRDLDDEVYPVWLNRQLGLFFGLSRWYERHLPPSGALFTIVRGDEPGTYLLDFDGTTDPELAPTPERMDALEHRRERVSRRPISVRDLMIELLGECEEGLTFNALWAEMNVVRATSRWQIASLLAYYPCFVGEGERWRLDEDAVDAPGREELAEFIMRQDEEDEEA